MSEVIDPNEVNWSSGTAARYPWEDWFDGRCHKLMRGEDYKSESGNFRQTVCDAARRMKVKVRVKSTKDYLILQAITGEDEE